MRWYQSLGTRGNSRFWGFETRRVSGEFKKSLATALRGCCQECSMGCRTGNLELEALIKDRFP